MYSSRFSFPFFRHLITRCNTLRGDGSVRTAWRRMDIDPSASAAIAQRWWLPP